VGCVGLIHRREERLGGMVITVTSLQITSIWTREEESEVKEGHEGEKKSEVVIYISNRSGSASASATRSRTGSS